MKKRRFKQPPPIKQNTVVVPQNVARKDRPKLPTSMGIDWRIPLQNLEGKSLFVAAPMYGGNCTGSFTRSMQALQAKCHELKIPFYPHYLFNESLIPRARNYCADEFLRTRFGGPEPGPILDAEGQPVKDDKGNIVLQQDHRPLFSHMLFIDADISFNPDDVIAMLGISDIGSPYDVMCAPYPKKCISWEKIKAARDLGFGDEDPNELERFMGDYVFNPVPTESGRVPLNQPVEILEGGTGFMLIQRQAFAKFAAKYPTQAYRPDHVRTKHFDGSRPIMAYFDCPIDRGYTFDDVRPLMEKAAAGEDVKEAFAALLELEKKASMRYLSEDYMFCQWLRKAGGKIWMCPWIKLQHAGTYIFAGALVDLLIIGQSATADPSQVGGKK